MYELYNITTDSEKIDEWNVEVVYINLNSNQNGHLNKNIDGKIIIQGNKLTLAEACAGQEMAKCYKLYLFNTLLYFMKVLQ